MALDNPSIARVLGEIADLLELKGENPFKIRAYRTAADLVSSTPEPVAARDAASLREWPGIGRDLAARIREICETGTCGIHRELTSEFPAGLLDLLRLQGVGPKTVALVYRSLGIASVDELEQAARAGRLRTLKGLGPRREEMVLRAIDERKRHANRHLLADAAGVAARLVEHLTGTVGGVRVEPVGSLRRGVETCGDLDLLASLPRGILPAAAADLTSRVMHAFTSYALVERVLGGGSTKSSVLIRGGYQADLRVVPHDSRGAALQYFTGSKAHNIALRDLALERGLRLNEYGLFRASDQTRLAGEREEEIYEALGFAWVPPELREHRGELEAAAARRIPSLVSGADLRGDLHLHTTESDGKDDLEAMVAAARDAGLEYVAITEHSKALAMANGLDEARALAHAARIRALDARLGGIRVLAGIECDVLPDGSLDLSAECLASLDLVIASVHTAIRQDEAEMTARLLKAMEHPSVDIVAHPTNRLLLRREPSRMDFERVARAAARYGVALEVNSQADRLDLSDVNARLARECGARLVVSSDAHARGALSLTAWGVVIARRAWATREDVMNTLPFEPFRAALRRNRMKGPL